MYTPVLNRLKKINIVNVSSNYRKHNMAECYECPLLLDMLKNPLLLMVGKMINLFFNGGEPATTRFYSAGCSCGPKKRRGTAVEA